MENESSNIALMETLISEWFLPSLFGYLHMGDIVTLDTAICSKPIREKWLECIAEDAVSMVIADKIRSFRINEQLIEWCFKKKIQFSNLKLNITSASHSISLDNATLLAMCCGNLVDLKLCGSKEKRKISTENKILCELGRRCTRLKKLETFRWIHLTRTLHLYCHVIMIWKRYFLAIVIILLMQV